jgi:hypothetical protein
MTSRKERLTVTVDPGLVEAGNKAVAAGRADSLSGWVNEALAARAAHDRRLQAMADAIAGYEREFGEITPEQMAAQAWADREAAIVVRGRSQRGKRATSRARSRGAA